MSTFLLSFCLLSMLLLLGKYLRVKIKLFQMLYLPSSVIGGLLGLLIVYLIKYFAPDVTTPDNNFINTYDSIVKNWGSIPGVFINLVFAALFLGVSIPSFKKIWNIGGPQFIYGQIVAWGQYVVGIGAALFLLSPLFGVEDFFGVIVPIGFEGGHGTAGGLTETFNAFNWEQGRDFALAAATIGMISGISVGMILINWATKRKYATQLRLFADKTKHEQKGIYKESKQRPAAGVQTVHADSIDSLAFHASFIGIAIFIGFIFKQILVAFNTIAPNWLQELNILNSFPLFPLCMLGGLLVQIILAKSKKQKLLDHNLMQRVAGAALDFLVVAAVATIKLEVISESLVPFLLICLFGIAWNVICVLFISRIILPNYWFERSIAEMGQSMGVTATGLLLLRTVDPNSKTDAPAAFGYKQLLHEPFMGGGLWTSTALPLAFVYGGLSVFLISLGALTLLLISWAFLRKSWQAS